MKCRRVLALVAVLLVSVVLPQNAWAQQIIIDANTLTVRTGNSNLLRYRYANVPFKPYIKELYTPSGINVLLDAPPDHLHHHGLMFACAVNNVDFWAEAPGPADGHFEPQPGSQLHGRLNDEAIMEQTGHRLARFADDVRWVVPPSRIPVLYESRRVRAGRMGKPEATVLTWESRLTCPMSKESIVLSGSHYHGLGLRFVRSMDASGEFRNPDHKPGVVFRGEERLVRSRWCAYTAQVDGKTVTVVMFDHPENARHPATWFMMAKPFAYLSATLRLHEEPLKILRSESVTLRYGVALWDGRPENEQIGALYQEWVKMEGSREPATYKE